MKLLILFALLVTISASICAAQRQSCHGLRWTASCVGLPSRGRHGGGCRRQDVWYYDRASGQCRPLHYWGCAGNNNRWCSRAACQRACRRAG